MVCFSNPLLLHPSSLSWPAQATGQTITFCPLFLTRAEARVITDSSQYFFAFLVIYFWILIPDGHSSCLRKDLSRRERESCAPASGLRMFILGNIQLGKLHRTWSPHMHSDMIPRQDSLFSSHGDYSLWSCCEHQISESLFLREIQGHVPASNQRIFINRSVHALVFCMFLSRVTLCHVNVELTASGPVTHTGMEIM